LVLKRKRWVLIMAFEKGWWGKIAKKLACADQQKVLILVGVDLY